MRDFFETMSYWGGILAMLVFVMGMVVFAIVITQEMREEARDDEPMLYDWETME